MLEYPQEVGPRPASLPWSLPHTFCTGGIHRESPCGGASGETSPSPTTVRGRVRPVANAVSRQALCSRAAPPRSTTTQRQLHDGPSRLADGSVTACDAFVTASVPENPRNPAATRHTYNQRQREQQTIKGRAVASREGEEASYPRPRDHLPYLTMPSSTDLCRPSLASGRYPQAPPLAMARRAARPSSETATGASRPYTAPASLRAASSSSDRPNRPP